MRRDRWSGAALLITVLAAGSTACRDAPTAAPEATARPAAGPTAPAAAAAAATAGTHDEPLPPLPHEAAVPAHVREHEARAYTGDLDGMIARRLIRAGVTYNRTSYFVDNGVQRGAAYEYLKLFEDRINAVLKTGNLRIHVVCLPMGRDQMLQALVDGRLDMADGQFTITPERLALVDFGPPYRRNVNEIAVTAPGTPAVARVEDLARRKVYVRKSSSYYKSLLALNERLAPAGKPPVAIVEMPESLDDDDLLEMVNAGLLTTIVVDDYLAAFWQKVLPKIVLNPQAPLRTGGDLAVAMRKGSPKLLAAATAFSRKWGQGSAFSNIERKKYLESTRYAASATAEAERRKFEAVLRLFRKYGDQYDVDYLLMAAQGYQESQLDQNVRSPVGAIGIMQIMPATAADLKVGDVHKPEPNVHGGVKYIKQLMTTYVTEENVTKTDRLLFAFASYNAGPARIRQLRREAERRGLDPNVWFGQVEQVVSARIGRETVTYVSNIFKYYVAYKLVEEQRAEQERVRARLVSAPK